MIKRFTPVLLMLVGCCTCWIAGCANVKDLQPPDGDQLPDSVVRIFNDAVPGAQQIVFKTLEKDWLYEVNYVLNDRKGYAGLDTKQILRNSRMVSAQLPDSLKQFVSALSLDNVTISELWEVEMPGQSKQYYSKCTWGTRDYMLGYLFQNTSGNKVYQAMLLPYSKFYVGLGRGDLFRLPAKTQQILAGKKYGLGGGGVWVSGGDDDIYSLNVGPAPDSLTSYSMTFHKTGDILNAFPRDRQIYKTIDECPEGLRNYLRYNPPFSAFTLNNGYKFTDSGVSGYFLSLQSSLSSESTSLFFDGDFNVIFRTYNGSAKM
jgi:hypothetical protein